MQVSKYKDIDYSEVYLSELGQDMRFDADYWEASFLKNEDQIKQKKHTLIKRIAPNPKYGLSIAMNEDKEGYVILKMDNIMEVLADDTDAKYADISASTFNHFKLKQFDVLFNRVNSDEFVGRTGIYLLSGEHTFASYLVKVDSGNHNTNSYIAAFLNSKHGKKSLQRVKRRAVNQANINAKELGNLFIPLPSSDLQTRIKELLIEAQDAKLKTEQQFYAAEDILLSELKLKNWQPPKRKFTWQGVEFEVEDSVSEKYFSEVTKNWRFDAEHWEPQYDEIINAFNQFPRKSIGSLVCYPVSSGATPKAGGDDYTTKEDGYPFLRAVDLVDGRVITENFLYIKEKIHNGMLKRTQLKKFDILISIAGTVGRAAIFDHDFQANINQALSIIRLPDEKQVKRLYLVTLFNSIIGKKFVAKTARQGLQTNLTLKEVSQLEIPILPMPVQKKISDAVSSAFAWHDRRQHLISISKKSVELFIDQDEKEALNYIKNEKAKKPK
jgi:restriction endonuclease S subunit